MYIISQEQLDELYHCCFELDIITYLRGAMSGNQSHVYSPPKNAAKIRAFLNYEQWENQAQLVQQLRDTLDKIREDGINKPFHRPHEKTDG